MGWPFRFKHKNTEQISKNMSTTPIPLILWVRGSEVDTNPIEWQLKHVIFLFHISFSEIETKCPLYRRLLSHDVPIHSFLFNGKHNLLFLYIGFEMVFLICCVHRMRCVRAPLPPVQKWHSSSNTNTFPSIFSPCQNHSSLTSMPSAPSRRRTVSSIGRLRCWKWSQQQCVPVLTAQPHQRQAKRENKNEI